MDEAENRNWLKKEEAEAFIGKNSPYYLEKWKTKSDSTLKGWNWAAFFFGIQWMAYRKMYTEAVLYYFITVIVGLIVGAILWILRIRIDDNLLRTILQLFVGVFGNAIYRNKALRILRKARFLDEPERLIIFREKGGASTISVVVCISLQIAVAALLTVALYLKI